MGIRKNMKILLALLTAFMLASCSQTPSDASLTSPPATPSALASAASATATPEASAMLSPALAITSTPVAEITPTPSPVPIPTLNLTPDLPDPGKWKASMHLDAKDYPKVDGSTATLPLAIFMRSKITGESLGKSTSSTLFHMTGPAWEYLADKETDLLVVYEASGETKEYLKDSGVKLTIKPIGADALVFLTNSGNPVKNLSSQQVVDIYTGKYRNWTQLGGYNTPIIPYQRNSDSGSQALMLKLVMKSTKIMDAPEMLMPTEMGALVDDIASYSNTANALGYSVFYYVRNMYKVPGIKLLNINGVAPSPETIASGAYPYVNPFYAVIRSDEPADSNTHKLFDWLTGPEGKRAIVDAGYVGAN